MDKVREGILAWALVDGASSFLTAAERARVCATIGAGEHDDAIIDVLTLYAGNNADMPRDVAESVGVWIDGFSGTDSEPGLRELYRRITVAATELVDDVRPHFTPTRSPQPLIAKRAVPPERSAKLRTAAPAIVCGVDVDIAALLGAALEARRLAQTASEVAVREAHAHGWSWEAIAAALGVSDTESLRRRFRPNAHK